MQKNSATLFLLISLLMPCIAGCKESRKYRIGVSQCSSDDWRQKMNAEIEREILLHPDAEVEIRSAEDDSRRQIEDIRYFRDSGFDILIVAPNEAAGLTPVIKEVHEGGMSVVIFDRDINGSYYTSRQQVDNIGLGMQAAEYAATLLPDGGKVIEIRGLDGSTPSDGRSKGFHQAAPAAGLDIVASAAGNWNNERAESVADSMLVLFPDAGLVYAHNDRMAIAAAEVARRRGLDLKVIGIDAAPEIGIRAVSDGRIDATFLYPTEGHRLIRTAMAILKGEKFDREILLPHSSAVDKTNADILLLQNHEIEEQTEQITYLKDQVADYWTRHSAQTTLFYAAIIILLLLSGLLFTLLRAFWAHKRWQREILEQNSLLQAQRDNEKALNEQLREATRAKLVFFTNVSHDLRTPLTLISEPVRELARANNLTPSQHSLMQIAAKNVRILRRLINQILDFRKFENGKMTLSLSEVCVGELLVDWVEAFRPLAVSRGLKLSADLGVGKEFTMSVDVEKLERVFFNLVSNAIKYTPAGGRIMIDAAIEGDMLVISVSDTGLGISAEDLGNIFDRFFQVDKIHPNGSGIGLSLAKAFVELHDGTITADSQPDQGSVFTVSIPVRHVAATESPQASITSTQLENDQDKEARNSVGMGKEIYEELAPVELIGAELPSEESDNRPRVLIVDDNPDIRTMVRLLLKDDYRVLEADNGQTGFKAATRMIPDLIICDVMMPGTDGLECCRQIKEEPSTTHIPVLMLTACSMDEQRIQGYDSGADGYLAKPFDGDLLKKRIENLIANRLRLRKAWSEGLPGVMDSRQDEEPKQRAGANEFYDKFLRKVNEEMDDPDLSVDSLASQLGMGRSQFYRKIKALTGYSPVELLRNLRLSKGRELLLTTDLSISEIAYRVGFASPAYFTRCYRTLYNETPSDVRSR